MLHRFRHVFGLVFLLLVASCSSGGCGGCAASGVTPLAGGFPTDKAVDNAASVRVSRPGLDFLEKELGHIAGKALGTTNGVMNVGIPESPYHVEDVGGFLDVDGKICPGGPDPKANPPKCAAAVDLGASTFVIDAITPSSITVSATVPLELDDTPVSASFGIGTMTLHVGYGANGQCAGANSDRVSVEPKALPVKITIPLVPEATPPRTGYTKIDVDAAVIDLAAVSSNDVQICANCTIFTDACNSLLNSDAIKGNLVDQLKSGLDAQVKAMLKGQLCTKPTPGATPACPTGSSPDGSNALCVYDADKTKCVPALLGGDGHAELGALLKAFSPSTTGAVDFGLAAFGPMSPAPGLDADGAGRTPNGVTLGLRGGVLPQPTSRCIVPKDVAPPKGVPVPDELAPTTADSAGTPHVGVAMSGRFLDYSLTNAYNSGLLCLGIATAQVDMLKTGLLSVLVPSLKTLTFEQGDAAAAIMTRPGAPPTLKLGGGTDLNTDPLLLVSLPKLALDFYIWSFDRFVRVFTYTADLTVPVNLQTGKGPNNPNGGLLPTIGAITVANGVLSNADVLLLDDPNFVAGAVGGIFGDVSKQLVGGGLSPIDLSSMLASFGLGLQIDEIKKLTKGTDEFLGVFATLTKAAGTAMPESDTQARLVARRVWKDHLQASTYERAKLPELELELGSSLDDGTRPIEYTWWIDEGTRSPWSTAKHVVIKDDQLFMQGRRVLHVASRVVGRPETEDTTPAEVPYVIDALAPFGRLERTGSVATLSAWDLVSAEDALVARYRLDGGEPSAWRPLAELARFDVGAASSVEVEVKDEEGNVGVVRQAIRGVEDPTLAAAGAACGCSAPGATGPGGLLALAVGAAALALIVLRRRGVGPAARLAAKRGGVALGAIGLVAATSQGCSCGDEEIKTGCGVDCNQTCLTGLELGQPGAFLSVAKAKDGTLWAAGYNDALLVEGDALLWGDLVVGKYDGDEQRFAWKTVDGLPKRTDGTCVTYEPYGWRNGETDSGDDVGRYTSLQLTSKDQPIVSYYDDTHHRLKLAVRDREWSVFVLREQSGADVGKYSKMLVVDGKPVVAFMQLEPGSGGRTRTKIVVARSRVETPQSASDFDFEDVAADDDGPCRATSCEGTDACVKETGACTKTVNGCQPACADGSACVLKDAAPTCVAKTSAVETYPRGLGPYIGFASGPDGLGIVAYDGFHGNLMGFIERGRKSWERVLLDGETGNRADATAVDTGDVGVAASLLIGSDGTWHVSYVNGTDESLRYLAVKNGKPSPSELVDDGFGVGGEPFADGKHIVGDDSVLRLDGDEVTIYYADSTSLGLRRAVGAPGPSGHRWTVHAIAQDGRWLAFPQPVPGDKTIAAWWRQSTRATKTVEGDVMLLAP